jgi:hypothetical protein
MGNPSALTISVFLKTVSKLRINSTTSECVCEVSYFHDGEYKDKVFSDMTPCTLVDRYLSNYMTLLFIVIYRFYSTFHLVTLSIVTDNMQ